jgi:hypothetical protein
MSNEVFVWVNLGVGFLLILLLVIGKRGALKPSSLNLRRGEADPEEAAMKAADRRKPSKASANVHFHSKFNDSSEAKAKNLNVIFMFNGHSFDAYEILGIPAGSSLEVAEKAYHEAIKNKPADEEFFSAAWAAIKHDRI